MSHKLYIWSDRTMLLVPDRALPLDVTERMREALTHWKDNPGTVAVLAEPADVEFVDVRDYGRVSVDPGPIRTESANDAAHRYRA